jgi:L-malate glycosyltransferase
LPTEFSSPLVSGTFPAIRVLIIGPSLRSVGGQSVQVDLLMRNWANDREVDARFIPVDPEFPGSLRWVSRIPVLRTLLREPFHLAELWRGLGNADIAHVFSASYWSFLLSPVAAYGVAKLRNKKIVIHYHSGEAADHLARSRLTRRILKRVDCVAVPSGYLVDIFKRFNLGTVAVPNFVDFNQFAFRRRCPVRPRLICTRGFHPYYRVADVVRAFSKIKSEYPAASLLLLGSGPREREVRDLVQSLGLSDVVFTGSIARDKIGRYYDEADIFVNASSLDNMPVSILEAFASGTLVATSAPEGIRYLVEDGRTGLLSAPGDWRSLAENTLRFLRDPELARCIAANAYEQSKAYGWENVRGKWLALYRGLLGNKEADLKSEPVVEDRLPKDC